MTSDEQYAYLLDMMDGAGLPDVDWPRCRALLESALRLLDGTRGASSPASCHVQHALDAIRSADRGLAAA